MFGSKGQNSVGLGSNLLKRILLELQDLREVMTFCTRAGPRCDLRRAQVLQFAPIVISPSREKSGFSRQSFPRWP
jgi:hypothetical protein